MRLSKRSKKVSWAPDANLCQTKLFQSKDCPSQVCCKVHDDLLEKKSWILHSDGLDTTRLPHGLKVGTCLNQIKKEISHIPKIRWKCPPKFVLSSNWLVASGEESQESETQKLREKQVVEAVYSLMSAIPPSPSVSLEIEECHQDDSEIPLVPITPMEDEETVDTLSDLAAPISTTLIAKPPALSQDTLASGNPHTSQYNGPALEPASIEKPALGTSLGIEAHVIAAATAAVTMVLKCMEPGSLIDTDLLIKILTNPKLTEKLINDRLGTEGADTIPLPESIPVTPLVPLSCKAANGYAYHQPKKMQPSLDSTSLQEDTFPVSWPNQVAHRVPLPQANGNMPSLLSDRKSPLDPVSCVKPVALPQPESNMYPLPGPEPAPDRVLSPRRDLNNILERVQPTPDATLLPSVLPTTSYFTVKSVVKDANYYKSLVKQHGEEKQGAQDQIIPPYGKLQGMELKHKLKLTELKAKFQKSCIFYNSPTGCRNGSNCSYQHDTSSQLPGSSKPESKRVKRMKLDEKIPGRN